jgi:hypothetical protein
MPDTDHGHCDDGRRLWWCCVWGHVFAAPVPPEGGDLACPGDDGGPCGTYFLYQPFPTQEEARAGRAGGGEDKWAPWARGSSRD